VLVQRGRGGGLAGAFGSGGGSTSAFGTKTGDVFTWATVILFAVFMLMAIWLNLRFPAQTAPVLTSQPAVASPTAPENNPGNLSVEPGTAPTASTAPLATPPASAPATSTSQPK
jgi:preprotein translocase subunit SecG